MRGLSEGFAAMADLKAEVARTGRADLQAVLNWLTDNFRSIS